MSTILITGGLGFVGGRIAKKLSSAGQDVTISTRHMVIGELELHGAVGLAPHSLLLVKEHFPAGIETVIHLAALNEHDCVKNPSEAIRVNIDETRIILENSIAAGVKRFIYFSTAHIYGSPLAGRITELSLPAPVHPYAITHKAAEDYVLAAGQQGKIYSTVIRLSNSFGAPVSPLVNRWTLLANDLCRQAVEKEQLVLLSNGCQYRDFICLTDVAQVIEDMLLRPASVKGKELFNLGSGKSVRVIDMANTIAAVYAETFGKSLKVQLPADAVTTTEPGLQFSIDHLLSAGYHIKNDVHGELKELLLFCAKHFSKVASS